MTSHLAVAGVDQVGQYRAHHQQHGLDDAEHGRPALPHHRDTVLEGPRQQLAQFLSNNNSNDNDYTSTVTDDEHASRIDSIQ